MFEHTKDALEQAAQDLERFAKEIRDGKWTSVLVDEVDQRPPGVSFVTVELRRD